MGWQLSSARRYVTHVICKKSSLAVLPLTLFLVGLAGCRSTAGENVSDTFVSYCTVTPATLKANTCLNFQKASPCFLRLHGYTAPDKILKEIDSASLKNDIGSFEFTDTMKAIAKVLAPEEMLSIQYYTSYAYHKINTALRGDKALFESQANMIYAAASGLNKLEKFEGTVYRSEKVDLEKLQAIEQTFKPNNIVLEEVFLSTAKEMDSYIFQPIPSKVNIIYTIQSKSGRDIEGISLYPLEKEVLFTPGSAFRVLSFNKAVDEAEDPYARTGKGPLITKLKIELEEIDPYD